MTALVPGSRGRLNRRRVLSPAIVIVAVVVLVAAAWFVNALAG